MQDAFFESKIKTISEQTGFIHPVHPGSDIFSHPCNLLPPGRISITNGGKK
jgi:hypothetical protein